MQNYLMTLNVYFTGCEVGKYGDDCRLCPGCQTCDVSSGLCSRFVLKIWSNPHQQTMKTNLIDTTKTMCTHYIMVVIDNYDYWILEGSNFTNFCISNVVWCEFQRMYKRISKTIVLVLVNWKRFCLKHLTKFKSNVDSSFVTMFSIWL